jgi:Protein of unknown function (DUF3606)
MTHDFLHEPMDRSRIELVEDHELRFWTRELHCSAEHLLDAIESVGVATAAVVDYLAMRRDMGTSILLPPPGLATDRPRSAGRGAFNESPLP